MMSQPVEGSPINPHRLELIRVDLIGGGREIAFHRGLNIVQGDITTGKTTLVRLIRALFGTVPQDMAPETDYIQAVRGHVLLGEGNWKIYRPRTTTRGAPVEVSEEFGPVGQRKGREPVSLRLPASSGEGSYSVFLLGRLGIPVVSVPQARSEPTGIQTPVTMTDWLGYCIVTGDEIDTQVFGHQRVYRDAKRRWVFELAYGYYDPEMAILNAELRSIELRLDAIDHEAAIRRRFLDATPFADKKSLERLLTMRQSELEAAIVAERGVGFDVDRVPGAQALRQKVLELQSRRADLGDRLRRIAVQVDDLSDLHRQLESQVARLTRAIVADEWLVDFDFVVCPRCGNDVDSGRAQSHLCYLCLQVPKPAPSRSDLLAEQDRVAAQIRETAEVVSARRNAKELLESEILDLDRSIKRQSEELDRITLSYVSERASQLQQAAAEIARLEADIQRLREYMDLVSRYETEVRSRAELEARKEEIVGIINSWELSGSDPEVHVQALEERLLGYLGELHIPDLGDDLSVTINRKTYLPVVAGRNFDELSSQGLKTLVNIAHALAHHTVAIDLGLPMPGLLILDGLSANAGFAGFDQARVADVYHLLEAVASEYLGRLQIVAVDNVLTKDLLLSFAEYVVLSLDQDDRLIRIPAQ